MSTKDIIGYCITIAVAIIGWSIATFQFSRQYKRNLKLSAMQKKRELQIEVVKDIRNHIEEVMKRNGKLYSNLLMLSEGFKVSMVVTAFNYKPKHWEEAPNGTSEAIWNSNLAISNLLFFFDHRQHAKRDVEELVREVVSDSALLRSQGMEFQGYLLNLRYHKDTYTDKDADELDGYIQRLVEVSERIDNNVANISISLQEKYLKDIFD